MKVLRSCVLFILCSVAIAGNNKAIRCFECDDCDVLSNCLLKPCPADTEDTTVSPTSATSSPSTTSGIHTTTTTTTPPTPAPTHFPPIATSTVPTSRPTTTDSEETTTTESGTSSTTETEETTESSTSSHTSPDSSSTELTSSTTQARTLRSELIRNRSRRLADSTSVSYHCFRIQVVEDNRQKTKRGCVKVQEDQSACLVLQGQYCSAKNCMVCSTDGCNSTSALRASVAAGIAMVLCAIWTA